LFLASQHLIQGFQGRLEETQRGRWHGSNQSSLAPERAKEASRYLTKVLRTRILGSTNGSPFHMSLELGPVRWLPTND